jgi:SAM-dependent methyltransferase
LCGGALAVVIDGLYDTRFGIDGEFRVARCATCRLEQTVPRPPPATLNGYYADHYSFGTESGTAYARVRELFQASWAYRLWLALDGDVSFHTRRGRGRLIDIGCNEGRGLALYARNGFDAVEGLETNQTAAGAARRRGFVVHTVALADFQPNRPYDVAVLSNVLEHVFDPAEMLRQVRRILAPGGEVWISCPNAASWQRQLFGRAWINWHVPFHLAHFTDDGLSRTITAGGLVSVEQAQVTPALWLAQSVMTALAARPRQPTRAIRRPVPLALLMALARVILFPALWLGNRTGHGDCLVRVARRAAA